MALDFSICIMLILRWQDIPTLVPADPFDPNGDALQLFGAFQGFETDNDKIVSVLFFQTASQREVITSTYDSQHGVRLKIILKMWKTDLS